MKSVADELQSMSRDAIKPLLYTLNRHAETLGKDLNKTIPEIAADGLHRERTILFLDQRQPFELQRYHYHHWTQAPPDLIREHLLQYLRTVRVADRVVRYKPGVSVDGIIYGKIIRFERIIDGKDVKVNVSMELGLQTDDSDEHEWEKEYSATVSTQEQKMPDTVLAFGTALEQIYEHFVTDLEAGKFKFKE